MMIVRTGRLLIAAITIFTTCIVPQLAFAQIGNGACDRSCLEGIVDRYLDAVIDNDPGAVPLTGLVRFTENGQRLAIGDGLWNTMKAKGQYRLFIADVPAGQVGFVGTIEEDHRDPAQGSGALLALRLRIENGEISEIEQFVAVDEERGIVFSFVFFDHPGGETRNFVAVDGRPITAGPTQPWTWYIAELFRIENHQIAEIEALLQRVPYGMLSGWSTWEAGMSDRAQDVTM